MFWNRHNPTQLNSCVKGVENKSIAGWGIGRRAVVPRMRPQTRTRERPSGIPDRVPYTHLQNQHKPNAGQGNDVGTQYRGGIYYTSEAQRAAAEASKAACVVTVVLFV